MKTLVDESNDLQHLSRYETRFDRMYHRALKQLLELQDRRKLDGQSVTPQEPALDAPAPVDQSGHQPVEPPSVSQRAAAQPLASPQSQPRPAGSAQKQNLPNEHKYRPRKHHRAVEAPPPLAKAA
jgi:hypothetical protein